MTKIEDIRQNIARVQGQIAEAAKKAGRAPEEITLIAASKTQSDEAIRAAIVAGIQVCGENRVQELLPHLEVDAYQGAEVHFIGHLQSNKAKQVVGRVSLIQSVDSQRLVEELERQAQKQGIIQDILLEVNIGEESSKGGILPKELPGLVEAVKSCPSLRLRGLMCIPPAEAENTELRGYFREMRKLLVDIKAKMGNNESDIDCLSMGMSGDFPLAIEEGATMVRVGTALFGARQSPAVTG